MRRARLLVLFAIAVASPVTAYAQDGWWAWLEQMSGPGYYQGPMGSVPLVCWHDTDRVDCGWFKAQPKPRPERNDRLNKFLQVSFGVLTSNDRPRYKDLPATGANIEHVILVPVNATFMFRPHRSLDIGPGAGAFLFFGPNLNDRARFVLMPVAASWKFLLTKRSWPDTRRRRIFGLEFQTYYITKGFDNNSFGNSASTSKIPPELKGMIGLSIDLGEWR